MTPSTHTQEFEIEVIDRLGRIETELKNRSCPDHEARLRKLEGRLTWFRGGLAAFALAGTLAISILSFIFKFKKY